MGEKNKARTRGSRWSYTSTAILHPLPRTRNHTVG